jgi:hypothetical protein
MRLRLLCPEFETLAADASVTMWRQVRARRISRLTHSTGPRVCAWRQSRVMAAADMAALALTSASISVHCSVAARGGTAFARPAACAVRWGSHDDTFRLRHSIRSRPDYFASARTSAAEATHELIVRGRRARLERRTSSQGSMSPGLAAERPDRRRKRGKSCIGSGTRSPLLRSCSLS